MANITKYIDKITVPSGSDTITAYLVDNASGYITGISSSDVTTALGYTPANKMIISRGTEITTGTYSIDVSYSDIMGALIQGTNPVFADLDYTYPFVGYFVDNNVPLLVFGESVIVNGQAVTQGYMIPYGTSTAIWASQIQTIPSKTSDLQNDSGFLSSAVTSFNGNTGAITYTAPVTSVNGNTGAVTITVPTSASDVGALATTGGTLTGDITLSGANKVLNLSGEAAANSGILRFQRGTLTDNYNDWQVQDRGGYLYFDERGNGSTTWTNRVYFDTTGAVHASSFAGNIAWSNVTGTSGVQTTSNLVTSVSSSSTDSQYPSAKLFYDTVGNIETLLASI